MMTPNTPEHAHAAQLKAARLTFFKSVFIGLVIGVFLDSWIHKDGATEGVLQPPQENVHLTPAGSPTGTYHPPISPERAEAIRKQYGVDLEEVKRKAAMREQEEQAKLKAATEAQQNKKETFFDSFSKGFWKEANKHPLAILFTVCGVVVGRHRGIKKMRGT